MEHDSALPDDGDKITRRKKGNNARTNDLVQLSLDQYKKDKNLGALKKELHKISLMCSRSKLRF